MDRSPLPASSVLKHPHPQTYSSLFPENTTPAMSLSSIKPSNYPLTLSKHLQTELHRTTPIDPACEKLTPHCLFSPIHYEAGYAYPLIVWLHGPGDNENQLRTVLPLVSMRNYIAVGPRATTIEHAATVNGPGGKYNEPLDGTEGDEAANEIEEDGLNKDVRATGNPQLSGNLASGNLAMGDASVPATFCWVQSREEITNAVESVLDCINIARNRYNVHRDRIFIAGYDSGGTMAMRIALEYPQIFKGAISLGGPLPRGLNLLRRINEARKMPLLITNSLDSQKYQPEQVGEDLRLLHAAGFSLDLRQYPCGDELTTKMLSDMDQWIMNRFC